MKGEYYRVRVSFNYAVERDQMCIAYLQEHPEKQYETIKSLIYEGILAREAEVRMEEQTELISSLKQELSEKDQQIETLMQERSGDYATYFEIIAEQPEPVPPKKGFKSWMRRKNEEPEISVKKYKPEERALDPRIPLQELMMNEQLPPESMTMLSVAIDMGLDEWMIRSMIKRKLDAKRIRGVIDVTRSLEERKAKKEG